MLRRIRITLAVICLFAVTALFVDFTGTAQGWWGWLARIQLLPAVLALNVGIIIALIVLTLVLGRVYCSVICPLGVMQDVFGRLGRLGKRKKFRYRFSKAKTVLRLALLAVMIVAVALGIGQVVALLAPYSSFGRIVQSFLSPLWALGNNLLAGVAEKHESYAFYQTDVWIRSVPTMIVAATMLVVIGVLAWRNGRTWCNTVCPVGTVLGYLARFSLLKPVIDSSRCNKCGLCERQCKAACINSKTHEIDYSRCVACMDCLGACHKSAISYKRKEHSFGRPTEFVPAASQHMDASGRVNESPSTPKAHDNADRSRRAFLTGIGSLAVAAAIEAQEKKVDGGLAVIEDKKIPERNTPIVPPGALSLANLSRHCTACQLCVAACPNGVLRPSSSLESLMQPRSSYERGYCRPECTRCADVCPTGAIRRITAADKSAIQIGHAVWVRENCIPLTDHVECGNCARHCPVGAITMVGVDPNDESSLKIPVVNVEKCIGCGACENLCPARPLSAIYVEGHEVHKTV